jgi:gliding motility-associated-like protein
VPKIIPHKKLVLSVFFLSITWVALAQITIKKNGAGICPGGKIELTCDDSDLVDYTWEFLRPAPLSWSPLTDKTKSISHFEVGKYRLTARDRFNVVHVSNILDIIGLVNPPIPIITPSKSIPQICQGDSMILNVNYQSSYYYYWSFNGTQLSVPQSEAIKLVAKKDGKYEVVAFDNSLSSNSCNSKSLPYNLDYTSTVIVKIDSVPPFCALSAAPINLTVTPRGGRFKGKGITDAGTGTFSPSVAGVGKHEITYEVAQNGSCPSITDKRIISVSDLKPIITTNTGKTQFCVGDIASLSVLPDMKKYDWYKDGGATPVGALSKLDIGAGGKFNVKVIEKETLCSATSPDVNIEFFAASSVSIEPIASICGTDVPLVPLKGTPSGGAFTINGVFATTFDYKKLGFGKHKVAYVLNGSLPCLQGSAEQEVLIQDFPKPDLGPDILLGKGNSIKLKGEVDGGFTYSWLPVTDLDNPNLPNPVANPDKTTEYTLTVKTSLGCPGEGKVNIVVYQPVYIPSAFTPNSDGTNDLWELKGLEVYPNPEVQIFNRWGNIIFYSKGNYVPFDGTDSNKALPEGMYVYKINPFPDRPEFQYKGTFMLFR